MENIEDEIEYEQIMERNGENVYATNVVVCLSSVCIFGCIFLRMRVQFSVLHELSAIMFCGIYFYVHYLYLLCAN